MISEAERLVIDFMERHDLVITKVPLGKLMTVRCVGGEGVRGVRGKKERGEEREGERDLYEGRKRGRSNRNRNSAAGVPRTPTFGEEGTEGGREEQG
jgi:hypothetical protein